MILHDHTGWLKNIFLHFKISIPLSKNSMSAYGGLTGIYETSKEDHIPNAVSTIWYYLCFGTFSCNYFIFVAYNS